MIAKAGDSQFRQRACRTLLALQGALISRFYTRRPRLQVREIRVRGLMLIRLFQDTLPDVGAPQVGAQLHLVTCWWNNRISKRGLDFVHVWYDRRRLSRSWWFFRLSKRTKKPRRWSNPANPIFVVTARWWLIIISACRHRKAWSRVGGALAPCW